MKKVCVVALGGNAIIRKGERETYNNLLKNIRKTCEKLVFLVKKKYKLVITFGNGPEIGFLALQNELSKKKVDPMPFDILSAESQGLIGYPLEEQLLNELRERKLKNSVVTLITQVLVDKNDKAFRNPTKPIGPFYNNKDILKKKGFKFIWDSGRGYRRVVASPKPLKIVEIDVIKKLVEKNIIVIAAGGGGIPVYKSKGKLKGLEAVIDKDFASSVLASSLKADLLLILTSVDMVYLNYNKKDQKGLKKLNIKKALKYLKESQFGVGSMKPKIEASVEFLRKGGKKVIITSPEKVLEALEGKSGTLIVR